MKFNEIQHAIYKADITKGDALEGDCGPIARAIQAVFGGEFAVVEDDASHSRHATVLINGDLYDGTGKTSISTLCSLFADHPPDAHEGETVRECENIRVTSTLTGFQHNPALTEDLKGQLEYPG